MGEGLDGLETFEAMISVCPHQKVVLMSGNADHVRVAVARELGAAWIAKPYEASGLAKVVRHKMDQ